MGGELIGKKCAWLLLRGSSSPGLNVETRTQLRLKIISRIIIPLPSKLKLCSGAQGAQCCNPSRRTLLFGQMEHRLWVWFKQTTRKATASKRGTSAYIPPLNHCTKALEMPEKQSQKSCSRQKWRARSHVRFPERTFSLFSLIYMFVFLTEFQGCGARIVTEGQGELTSPNYPHQWESGGNCSWVIVGASQCKWRRLVFKVASLQVCPISL